MIKKNNLNDWPSFDTEEVKLVEEILLTGKVNYWTGSHGKEFEKEFAQWIGSRHSIAVANGTLALDLALKSLDIGPGDKVIVTPRSFIASVSSVINLGAEPIFCDVSRESGNITIDSIESVYTKDVKAILCVHLAGWPCDMDPIMSFAKHKNIYVIEDCAQAHGAKYKGAHVGSIGDIGAWSFCQDKIMSTGGEGGMVATNSKELWEKMWSYKDHGKNFYSVYNKKHPRGFRWLHDSFGTNFRITEFQAAIGRSQLKKMETWTELRRCNAKKLINVLNDFQDLIRVPVCKKGFEHAYYKLYAYLKIPNLKNGWNRAKVIQKFNDINIPCFEGSCSEIYKEKAFKGTDFGPKKDLPNAKELGQSSITFLVHPTLTDEDITYMQDGIKSIFEEVR